MFNFAENSCSDHCSTEVPFGQHKCSYKELRGQQCVQTACVGCDVAGPMVEMCCCWVQQRAGGTEGSNRTPVAVCSGRQAETEKKRDGENCTLTDKEILVRNVVFLGAFRKLRKKRLSASSCVPVRPSAWNISALNWTIFLKFGISLFLKICREKLNSLLSDSCHW